MGELGMAQWLKYWGRSPATVRRLFEGGLGGHVTLGGHLNTKVRARGQSGGLKTRLLDIGGLLLHTLAHNGTALGGDNALRLGYGGLDGLQRLNVLWHNVAQVKGATGEAGDGGHTLVGNVSGAAQGIVLSLNLLLGTLSLLAGLVLDEVDLGLVHLLLGLGNLQLLLDLSDVGLLGQHIDDGLLLVAGLGTLQGGGGVLEVLCGRLDEHNAVVLANGQVVHLGTSLCDLLSIIGCGMDVDVLGHDSRTLYVLGLHDLLLLLLLRLLNGLDELLRLSLLQRGHELLLLLLRLLVDDRLRSNDWLSQGQRCHLLLHLLLHLLYLLLLLLLDHILHVLHRLHGLRDSRHDRLLGRHTIYSTAGERGLGTQIALLDDGCVLLVLVALWGSRGKHGAREALRRGRGRERDS